MKLYFDRLASWTFGNKKPSEEILLHLSAEDSDFCRFNQARIRQIGHVRQLTLKIKLIEGRRHLSRQINISGDLALDQASVLEALDRLRPVLSVSAEDPYFQMAPARRGRERETASKTFEIPELLSAIDDSSKGLDLTGILAAGPSYEGLASSLGHWQWSSSNSFNFDWSLYDEGGRASKLSYAGFEFDREALEQRMVKGRKELDLLRWELARPGPGTYRVYLAPAAMAEIFGLLAWQSFSLKSLENKASALNHLASGERQLSPRIELSERPALGASATFDSWGFEKPEAIALIGEGRLQGSLVSARSSREFNRPCTAHEDESPEALFLAPGDLPDEGILSAIGNGFFINNLWYMNFSDASAARLTGMTRFACFEVRDGEVYRPLQSLRFDDSFYRMFGEGLLALSRSQEMVQSASTYEKRSLGLMNLPGALIEGLRIV